MPWSLDLIVKYQDYWHWEELAENVDLSFVNQNDLEKLYEKNLITSYQLAHFPIGEEFIDRIEDEIDWDLFSYYAKLSWSVRIIEKYKDKFWWPNLCLNESIPWSAWLIKKFYKYVIWSRISINPKMPWSIEFIEEFEGELIWGLYNTNTGIIWDIPLLEKFESKIDEESRNDFVAPKNFLNYKPLTWSDLSWNYHGLRVLWSSALIEGFKDKWHWEGLSQNRLLPWSSLFVEQFQEKWSWYFLSLNGSVEWSVELLEKYFDKLEWSNLYLDNVSMDLGFVKEYFHKMRPSSSLWKTIKPYIDNDLINEILLLYDKNSGEPND